MINAFLVFNGQGQPRLTKFYTQLVSPIQARALQTSQLTYPTGDQHPAAIDIRDLHTRIEPTVRVLQLPAPPAAPRRLGHLPHLLRGAARRPLPRHVPPLRDPLLHHNLHVDRVAAGPHRPDTGLRRGPGPAVRERVRAGPHLQLRVAARHALRDDHRRGRRGDEPRPDRSGSQGAGHRGEAAGQRGPRGWDRRGARHGDELCMDGQVIFLFKQE